MKKETIKYYNAKSLAEILGVHYRTVLNWWKNGVLEGAHKSPVSNEILIPEPTANRLFKEYGVRIELDTL